MMTFKTTLLALVMMLFAAPAIADEDGTCQSDADCADGAWCIMMSCACADCAPGEDCPPFDCPEDGEGWCEFEDDDDDDDWGFYGGECDTDDECPLGFSCEMVSVPCATNPTCPPCDCAGCDPDDEGCEDLPCECPDCPEPEPCDPEEMGFCVYDMVDCEDDADCGEGFECLEVEECWGSGGGCACPPCACETCVDGEECEPCECEPCECDDEPEEWIEEEGYCVPDGWSEIIEEAGGMDGAGSYEEARDAMAGEIWGDGEGGGNGSDKDLQLSAPEASADLGAADEDSALGCATGQAAGGAPMAILFLAIIALAILPRRRTVTNR